MTAVQQTTKKEPAMQDLIYRIRYSMLRRRVASRAWYLA